MSRKFTEDIDESDIIDAVSGLKDRAKENAPATVNVTIGGTIVGAAILGPAGAVVGAVVGSSTGYLIDEGYLDEFNEEPEELEIEMEVHE